MGGSNEKQGIINWTYIKNIRLLDAVGGGNMLMKGIFIMTA